MQEIDEEQIKAWDKYIAELKGLYRKTKWLGFLLCLIGLVLYLVAVWFKLPQILGKLGIGIIGLGWVIFAYAIVKRTKWARENRPIAK